MSLTTLQVFRKVIETIDRLQISVIGFPRISAPCFKNFPERLSMSAAFEMSIFCIILKTFSLEISLKWKDFPMTNLEQHCRTDCKLYLLGALGSIIKRASGRFEEKSWKIFAYRFFIKC